MLNKRGRLITAIVSALLYFLIFYHLKRTESLPLLASFTALFAGYLYFIYVRKSFTLGEIITFGLVFRFISLLAIPSLSDDFYRFIWDGALWSNKINPFAYRPEEVFTGNIIPLSDFLNQVYQGLNSRVNYTVYPTIPQLINVIAYLIGQDNLLVNVVVQRLFILAAEMLSMYYLIKILQLQKQDRNLLLLYALNPLVILELAGNLHHEALMIAFFLGAVYLGMQKKMIGSGVMLALAIASKLLPLMFVPLMILRTKAKIKLIVTLGIAMLLLFLPLLDRSFIQGMWSSLTLYYQKFEFNAGLYYLLREVGFWLYGYNAIAIIGKLLFLLAAILIIIVSFRSSQLKLNTIQGAVIIYLIFALCSLILHPWYILILVALAPISRLSFSIPWSYFIFLTYLGYSATGYEENYWLLGIEYVGLLSALVYDWRQRAFSRATLNEAP